MWLNSFTRMRVNLAAQVISDVMMYMMCFCINAKVMSETVASALQRLNRDATSETCRFIRMIDTFLIA